MASEINLKQILSKLKINDENQSQRIQEVIKKLESSEESPPKKESAFHMLCLIYSLIKQNAELLTPPNLAKLNDFCVKTIEQEIPNLLSGMSQPDNSILLEADFKNSTEMLVLMNCILDTLKHEKYKNNNQLHGIFKTAYEAIMQSHAAQQHTPDKTLDAKRSRC